MQILINHTGDNDLKAFLEDLLENSFTQEADQTETILKEAGIRLPPAPPDRPNVELQDIPAGARFNDAEIADLVKKELMTGKITCRYKMRIVIREDIEDMIDDFYTHKETIE